MRELDLVFRLATDFDVEKIYAWLLDHARRGVHGSFLCNWNLTQQVHGESQLFAAALEDEPIAYIWGDFGILEVREEFRQKGVGRRLVEYAMECAINSGRFAVSVECEPESSIPFWKKMGFEFHSENKASLVFDEFFDFPVDGLSINVEIMFYPEQAKWDPATPPEKAFSPYSVLDKQGTIHLQHRVGAYASNEQYGGDAIIRICIDGADVYFDKARYSEARAIGVIENSGAFYVDKVFNNTLHR